MANTSYQISIGADFKDAKGGLKELGVAIKEVETIAGGFAKRAEGLGNRLEAIFGGKLNQKLKNLGSNILLQSDKLAASSSPLSGAQLGSKLGSFRVKLENYGAQQSEIDALLSEFKQANAQAIKNFYEQVSLANREAIADAYKSALQDLDKATEYARKIVHDGKLDSAIHRDTRDAYSGLANFDIDKVELSDLYKITESLREIRLHTAQVIEREIKNLERDALAANRAIKAADITRVESRIGSYREVLGTGEVARLKDLLQNTVSSVAGELQVKSTQGLLDAIQNVVENVTLSSKQLKAQLDSFRTQGESLGIQGSMFDGLDEVKRLTARIQEVERQELLQFQKDTRKRITDSLREILQKTSVDLQQIHKLSADFIQAGGTSDGFAKEGSKSIISELAARVREMVANGSEFTRALEQRYEQLFVSVGVQGEQLASLVGLVKASSAYVNKNAAAMRMTAVREQITKLLNDYNRVEEAVSKAIMDRMRRDWASVSAESFDTSFKPQLDVQKVISERNALVQKMEGIWKPFEKQLKDLEQLRLIDFSSYKSQLSEGFVKNLEGRLASVVYALDKQGGSAKMIDGESVDSIISRFKSQLKTLGDDLNKKVYDELEEKFVALRAQLQDVKLNDNISAMPKDISSARNIIDTTIREAIKRRDTELVEIASETKDLLDDITNQLARNDAVKRAKSMIRSQARSLGGEAALRYDIEDTLNAAEELARAVERFDKQLANQLRNQASLIARRKIDPLYSGKDGKGGKADNPYGMHPGIIANYRRQIPMQLTDIVVGLSTGQLPMYVLLQQGGQLKDMFGGIGNAVKEVTKYLLGWTDNMTKFQMATAAAKRVLATVAVGAIAGMALLMKKAADFNAAIKNTSVELKFSGAGINGDEFRDYAERMSRSLGIARNTAASLFKQIAIDAKLPKESFDALVEGLEDISTALGNGWDTKGLQETVKLLGESFKDKDSFKELAADYALFTDEQYKAILQLYDQKDASGAAALAMETLKENTRGAAEEAMTPFQKTVKEAKEELLRQLQVVGDGLPWQTLMDNISATMKIAANFIGVIVRMGTALSAFVSMIGNTAVGAAFKIGGWLQGRNVSVYKSDLEGATQVLDKHKKALDEISEKTRNGSVGSRKQLAEYQSALTRYQSQSQFVSGIQEQLNQANAAVEASTLTASDAFKEGSKGLKTLGELLSGAADGAKELASASGIAKTNIAGLKTHPNDKEDKRKKGGKGGGKSQMEKDADAAEKYILKLQEAWDNYKKLTKLEQLSFDLEHGKVKMTAEQIAKATELAKAIDERARKEADELRIMERKRMEAQKMMEVQNKIQEYALQAARMQRADSVVDYYQQMLEYDNQLAQRMREYDFERRRAVRDATNSGRSNQIADINRDFDERIALERQKTEELKKLWDAYYREQIRLGTSWLTGFEKGLDQVAFKVKDLSSEVASAVESWADQMGDALANFVRTGKMDFKSFVNSILDDIARIAANNLIRNLIGGFKYGFGTPIADSGHKEVQDAVGKFKSLGDVQRVWVENMPGGLSNIGSTIGNELGKFTLGSQTSLFGNPSKPVFDFSSATQIGYQVAERSAKAIEPVVKAGSQGLFSKLTSGLGSIFNNIFSGLGNVFSGFGGGSFGGGGGFFSSLFSGIGSFFKSIFGFSTGGYTGPGGKYTPAGIVHAGEFVINAASTRRLGLDFLNRLNGYADGGYVSPTPPIVHSGFGKDGGTGLEVNIYNQGNDNVRAERNSSGGLDIFIEQAVNAVAGNISAGGSVAAAIQRHYGLNRGAGTARTGY